MMTRTGTIRRQSMDGTAPKCRPQKALSLLVTSFSAWVAVITICADTFAQSRTELIVESGQAVPNGNGEFSTFSVPALNDAGQTVFSASLTGTSGGSTDNTGIFRSSALRTGGVFLSQVARKGQATPDGNGSYSVFYQPQLNASGLPAFAASLTGTSGGSTDDYGIFRGSGSAIVQIFRTGQVAPDGDGTFSFASDFDLNGSGQVAFRATLTGTTSSSGIFRGSGGTLTQIVRRGQAAPDGNGSFGSLNQFLSQNDFGQIVFQTELTGTSGGTSDNAGVFRGSGSVIAQIARAGQIAPGGNGLFSSFSGPQINNLGQTSFSATLTGTSGGSADDRGLFRESGGVISQIAREGQATPDGNGSFSFFSSTSLNNSGQVAFTASLTGTSGGSTDDKGVFRGSGGVITQIARAGQSAPDGNGTFSDFSGIKMNDSGQAVFRAGLTDTSGGLIDNEGIYTGDGIDLLKIVRHRDMVAGGVISGFGIVSGAPEPNEHGQIAYRAILTNGNQIINLWTPDLHWRAAFSSSWDASSRWTLGLSPAQVHDVFIDPSASLTVTGPGADTTVRSLTIGGNAGLATLNLRNGSTLTATNGVNIQSTGKLTGDGIILGDVVNNGTVVADNVTVIEGTLTNHKFINGDGRIDASIVNASGGRIRALGGDTLWLSGPSFANAGLIEVHNGSELQVDAPLVNQAGTGMVSLRDGSLIADAGINNSGSIAMTLGASTIQGDINNNGVIQVSGGAHATFFDDLTQNGVMQVAAVGATSSTAVILGAFTGSGGFVGGGDVFALGDLRPGNSPASVLYDGNLFLGTTTKTLIELGGLTHGEYDQMVVGGDLNLAGDLFVSLINGHTLRANQFYRIGEVGGDLFGQFNGLGEGSRVGSFGGRDLFITYASGNGNDIGLFTAVPESSATLLMVLVGCGLTRRRTRRKPPNTPKAAAVQFTHDSVHELSAAS